jgi:hypothetical protein
MRGTAIAPYQFNGIHASGRAYRAPLNSSVDGLLLARSQPVDSAGQRSWRAWPVPLATLVSWCGESGQVAGVLHAADRDFRSLVDRESTACKTGLAKERAREARSLCYAAKCESRSKKAQRDRTRNNNGWYTQWHTSRLFPHIS